MNRDKIKVKYVNLNNSEECWVLERRLQVIAYDHSQQCRKNENKGAKEHSGYKCRFICVIRNSIYNKILNNKKLRTDWT